MKPYVDLVGQVFERLTVLEYAGRSRWKCLCECGVLCTAVGYALKQGTTKSCGCYGRDARRAATSTHNKTRTVEYKVWANMIQRCTNPKNRMFYRYGGRGVVVCERWRLFENFLADMGTRPSASHTIDRIDSSGNYELMNCRWLLKGEQSKNRDYTIKVDGLTLREMAEATGVKPHTLYQRIRRNRQPGLTK